MDSMYECYTNKGHFRHMTTDKVKSLCGIKKIRLIRRMFYYRKVLPDAPCISCLQIASDKGLYPNISVLEY